MPVSQPRIELIAIFSLLAVVATAGAQQNPMPLASTMSAQSNYVEYRSDAFSRINIAPGFYGLSSSTNPSDPRTTSPTVTFNPNPNLFPNGQNFVLGSVGYDTTPLTGVGVETRSVTSMSLDVFQDIARIPHTTTVSDLMGSMTFTNGTLSSMDFTADLRFTYTTTNAVNGLTFFEADGLMVSGNQISLFVDDLSPPNPIFGISDWRSRWDAFGTVNAVVPIPEPSLLLVGGVVLLGFRRFQSGSPS
jgi:hypothetical protein